MGDFFAELKRRNVIRVGAFYAVAGWLVLQVADVLFGLLGVPDWSLRLVFALLLLGLPIVLVLSWAFELTPEGLKRDTGRAPATIRSGDAARKLDIATIALLVVTIGIVAWDRTTGRSGAHVGAPADSSAVGHEGASEEDAKTGADGVAAELSIAVLPFANISGNADNEYFSDGLSEELLNLLAKIPDFKVAGRTSSFAYKGRNDDLRKIGAALDVANVLEGSVRRQADRVRITAQLVDAETGYHRWSETYDRTIEDIFAVQEEIATEVVRALRTTLLNEDQRVISSVPRTEVAAYDRYLKGQEYARDRTREGLARAVDAFKDAIVLDPNYAPAWSGLAMAYALQQNYGYIDTGTVTALIEPALDRALALDPDNSEALAVRGIYLHNLADGRSPPEALKSLERAIAANPNNAMAHFWLAQQRLPDRHAAARLYERALELDPQAPIVLRNYAVFLSSGGDAAGAARVLEQLEAVAPDWFSGWLARAEIAMQEGRIADAALAAERARDLNPDYVGILDFLAWSYWMLDENEAALAVARQAVRQDPGEKTRAQLAYLDSLGLVARDEFARAFETYQTVVGARPADPDAVHDLAAFALANGRPEQAIAILADRLGYADGAPLPVVTRENAYAAALLGMALRETGQRQAAAEVGHKLVDAVAAARASGLADPVLDVGLGLGRDLQGQEGALAQGIRDSIRAGWRNPPEELELLDPGDRQGADFDSVIAEMAAVLEAERRKYLAAKDRVATES